MTDTYKVTSSHDEDLADGRTVAPGTYVKDVDIEEPANAALAEEGRLTLRPPTAEETEKAKKDAAVAKAKDATAAKKKDGDNS